MQEALLLLYPSVPLEGNTMFLTKQCTLVLQLSMTKEHILTKSYSLTFTYFIIFSNENTATFVIRQMSLASLLPKEKRNSNYKKWFQSFRKEIERKYTKIFKGLYLCEGIIDYFSLFYQLICIF